MKKNIIKTTTILAFSMILFSCKSESKKAKNENSIKETQNIKLQQDKEIVKQKENNLKYSLDENLTYKDILNQKEYERLLRDKNYIKYIDKLWKTNIKFNKGQFSSMLELEADLEIWGDKAKKKSENDPIETRKKLVGLGKLIGKALWKGAKGVKNTYGLIELENEKKELYKSFSSKKRKIADSFEKKIFKIIDYSCNFPKNPNVKNDDLYQNFKSFGESLKNDDEVFEYLEPISEDVEDFLLNNVELKQKLMINKILNNNDNQNNSKLLNYGKEILLSNGNFKVNVTSDSLEDFYKELNNIVKSLNSQNFEIPIEDWSDEKQMNFNFIINDIKLRLKKEVESLNI